MTTGPTDGISRRAAIGAGAVAAAATSAVAGRRGAVDLAKRLVKKASDRNSPKKMRLALQLYSVRGDCKKDFRGTVETVGAMGYEGVEFAGYYGTKAKDLDKLLKDNGLKPAGTHTQLNTLLGDNLKRTIEFHKTIGNKYLIVPGLPKQYCNSAEAWGKTAKLFNELAAKVKPHGMKVGYHNHSHEFKPLGGKVPWDIFCSNTGPDVVTQIDTGNCHHGGGDAIALSKKYPGRSDTVHLKEYGKGKPMLGEGEMKWVEFLTFCKTAGKTDWLIVEQETYTKPPLECVKICLANLKKILAGM